MTGQYTELCLGLSHSEGFGVLSSKFYSFIMPSILELPFVNRVNFELE